MPAVVDFVQVPEKCEHQALLMRERSETSLIFHDAIIDVGSPPNRIEDLVNLVGSYERVIDPKLNWLLVFADPGTQPRGTCDATAGGCGGCRPRRRRRATRTAPCEKKNAEQRTTTRHVLESGKPTPSGDSVPLRARLEVEGRALGVLRFVALSLEIVGGFGSAVRPAVGAEPEVDQPQFCAETRKARVVA